MSNRPCEALYLVTHVEYEEDGYEVGFYCWERQESYWRRKTTGYRCIGGPCKTTKEAWKRINRFDSGG